MERMKGILERPDTIPPGVVACLHNERRILFWVQKVYADQKFIAHCEPGAKRR
jgi:hypothetical protein